MVKAQPFSTVDVEGFGTMLTLENVNVNKVHDWIAGSQFAAISPAVLARLRGASARQSSLSAALRAKTGGAEGIRTPDLLIANQPLYQLSYDPGHRRLDAYSFGIKTCFAQPISDPVTPVYDRCI